MCDYSLMGLPNRLARQDEELVVHRFPTNSLGLASPCDLPVADSAQGRSRRFWSTLKNLFTSEVNSLRAVCIPPGAHLLLQDISVEMRSSLHVDAAEHVTFTQLTAAPNAYRDAVRFRNGREVLLQQLHEGQRVTVLQMSLPEEPVRPVRETTVAR